MLNEEFEWNKDSIGEINKEETSVEERLISAAEVRVAISIGYCIEWKSGRAIRCSGGYIESGGESGVKWVTDICTEAVSRGEIPVD